MIAVVALVLSQLPPVRDLLKPRQLRIVIPDNLTLQHYMGNIQILSLLSLHNTGGRRITIQKVWCTIRAEEGGQWRLPAQTYVVQPASGQTSPELFMGWVSLKPGEHWSETVRFFKVWSIQEEEEATAISARIRSDISAKLNQRKPEEANKVMEAEPELVEEAKHFFEKKFNIAKGSYRLLVAAISDKDELVCVRGFDFTLFDHHIRVLRSALEDYNVGAGICYQNVDSAKGNALVRLRPIPEAEARAEYVRTVIA